MEPIFLKELAMVRNNKKKPNENIYLIQLFTVVCIEVSGITGQSSRLPIYLMMLCISIPSDTTI